LRCSSSAAQLRPVDEMASLVLSRLPPGALVSFGVYGGIAETNGHPTTTEVLADPTMQEPTDAAGPDVLVPHCSLSGWSATPSRRWVELADALEMRGVSTTLRSICVAPNDLFDDWLGAPTRTMRAACVAPESGTLSVDALGRPDCEVLVT